MRVTVHTEYNGIEMDKTYADVPSGAYAVREFVAELQQLVGPLVNHLEFTYRAYYNQVERTYPAQEQTHDVGD